jgi:hypothetical protein
MNKSLHQLATMSDNEFTEWLCTDHSEPISEPIYTEKDRDDEYRMDAMLDAIESDPNYQDYLNSKEE